MINCLICQEFLFIIIKEFLNVRKPWFSEHARESVAFTTHAQEPFVFDY